MMRRKIRGVRSAKCVAYIEKEDDATETKVWRLGLHFKLIVKYFLINTFQS